MACEGWWSCYSLHQLLTLIPAFPFSFLLFLCPSSSFALPVFFPSLCVPVVLLLFLPFQFLFYSFPSSLTLHVPRHFVPPSLLFLSLSSSSITYRPFLAPLPWFPLSSNPSFTSSARDATGASKSSAGWRGWDAFLMLRDRINRVLYSWN